MLRGMFGLGLMIVAMLLAPGCGDGDDCPACPTDVDTVTLTETVNDTVTINDTVAIDTRKIIITGEAYTDSGDVRFWCEINNPDGRMPQLDSLTLGGVKAENLIPNYNGGAISLYTQDEIPEMGTSSGDLLEIIAYTPFGNGTCPLTVLDIWDDSCEFIAWEPEWPYDTVALSEEIVIDWYPKANADWYAYRLFHYYDSSGSRFSATEYWTFDTTLTIASENNGYNGYWEIYLFAVSGPTPDDVGGNFTGCDAINGRFLSLVESEITIFVGNGDNTPPPTLTKINAPEGEWTIVRGEN